MKIEPRQVRFYFMQPNSWWRRLRFLPRGNSLQVQETALVVQGYLQKLTLPLFDILFRSMLSEWTTVTVPYSRILFLKTRSFIVWRVLATLVSWLPFAFCAVSGLIAVATRRPTDSLFYFAAVLGLLGLVLTYYINWWLLAARHYLLFEEPGGGAAMLCFRIKRRQLRRRFVELVRSHRRASQGLRPLPADESSRHQQGSPVDSPPLPRVHKAGSSALADKAPLILAIAAGLILGGTAHGGGRPNRKADLIVKNSLAQTDFLDLKDGTYFKNHEIPLKSGHTYRFDLESRDFKPYLRLRDTTGRELAVDGGLTTTARIFFQPDKDGLYIVLVTSFKRQKTGSYTLTVKEVSAEALWDVLIQRALFSTPREQRMLVENAKKYLAGRGAKLTKQDLERARRAAAALEVSARDLAAEAYATFALLLAASADPELARTARVLKGAAYRLRLLKQKLDLQGVLVDGQPLDWNSYRGKVVLVSFLDTSNPNARKEWQALRATYQQHNRGGFEVLGIGMDKNRDGLEKFLKTENFPWQCLDDASADGRGPGPIAEKLGVFATALPLNLLVNRDGTVLSTKVSKRELDFLLPNLLRPPSLPGFGKLPPIQAPDKFPRNLNQPQMFNQMQQAGTRSWAEIIVAVVAIVLVMIPFVVILAYQARKRGYSFVIWFLTGMLALNPLFPLVVLALLPYRARQALRRKEKKILNDKLAQEALRASPSSEDGLRERSVASMGAPAEGSTADFPGQSLGDQVTRV